MHGRMLEGGSLFYRPSVLLFKRYYNCQAAIPQLQRKNGYFDLLGFDFMITAAPENKLVLIEINTNPSLAVGRRTL